MYFKKHNAPVPAESLERLFKYFDAGISIKITDKISQDVVCRRSGNGG